MTNRLTELAFGAGWRVTRALPQPVARRLFTYGADRAYRQNGAGVQRLRDNLCRVVGADYPELDDLVARAMRSYARYWMEAFRLPSLGHARIINSISVENADLLKATYEQGNGAIVALPHAGNWDHAGAWACLSGYQLSTVAERLKPEALYQRFLEYRRSLGMEILPATGGERPPLEVLIDRLRSGGLVVLLADRDISSKGLEVSFFGGRIRVPAGPALLALRTGAPLFTAALWYEDDRTRVRVEGPLDLAGVNSASSPSREAVTAVCQQIVDRFAVGIAEHPQDWHMLQRLWLDDRSSKRGAASFQDPVAG